MPVTIASSRQSSRETVRMGTVFPHVDGSSIWNIVPRWRHLGWAEVRKLRHAREDREGRFMDMKIRKRHRIVLLFWVPFWSLAGATCALAGWACGIIRF